jgi:dynamin GTPase
LNISYFSFTWFKDDKEREKIFVFGLDGLKVRDIDRVVGRRHSFALFQTQGRNIYRDHKQLEFSCETQEDVDTWKAMFLRAGVYPESVGLEANPSDDGSFGHNLDPILERQVETIRNLVDSYIKIVTKKIKDQIPKIVTCFLINKTREFINGELLRSLLQEGEMLMEESPEESRRREELLRTYNSIREALKIIGEVNMTTTYVPPPPPVKNDWKPSPSVTNNGRSFESSQSSVSNANFKPSLPPPPMSGGHMNNGNASSINAIAAAAAGLKPTQTVPPRPKPNPAAFVSHNNILQPTKVPSRPAPTIPPRR